jgi:Cap4 dsDNA endonuclease
MPDLKSLPSVREKHPDDQGGPIARQGFSYQDDVAVGFLLDMVDHENLLEVHCETQDDILLLWEGSPERTAEYVQVKAGNRSKLWSVADARQRKPAKAVGTSLFEKSLLRDCCRENSRFRIVTQTATVPQLMILTYPRESRTTNVRKFKAVRVALTAGRPKTKSKKGNDVTFWLENCLWDVRHDPKALENAILLRIAQLSASGGYPSLPDQCLVLLDELRAKVKKASDALWEPDPKAKMFTRVEILAWWRKRIAELDSAATTQSPGKLREKMQEAGIDDMQIRLAVELRREYASTVRTRKYMPDYEQKALQQNVRAELVQLQSRLFAGDLSLDGKNFHLKCLNTIDGLDVARKPGTVSRKGFMIGCMYDITDRCLHRFNRNS